MYINWDVYHFLRFAVIFSKFSELFMTHFVRITRVRSATPRPMWNGALRVDGRDRDFKPWLVSSNVVEINWNSRRQCIKYLEGVLLF